MHPLKSDQSNVLVNYSTRVDLNDSPPIPSSNPQVTSKDTTNPGHLIFAVWRQATSQGYINREKEERVSDLYLLPFEDIRANRSGRVPGILRIKPTNDERKGVTSASGLTTGIDNVAERYTEEPG